MYSQFKTLLGSVMAAHLTKCPLFALESPLLGEDNKGAEPWPALLTTTPDPSAPMSAPLDRSIL